jgi:hypothetical protein
MAMAAAGCGKKGPPLAPIVRIPAAVQTIEARRIGSDVYVSLTVPAENIDGSKPADIDRIDVYGFTGAAPPPRGRFLEGATIVGTIPVAPSVAPGQPLPASTAGATQGTSVTVRDRLEPGDLDAAPSSGAVRRFYMALPYFGRRPGAQGTVAELSIAPLPEPPADVRATYSETAVALSWEPSGGLIGFLLDKALPRELPPYDPAEAPRAETAPSAPAGPTRYNVYRDIAPDPLALPVAQPGDRPVGEPPPMPLNPMPLDTLVFTDPLRLDERRRCYTVRALRGGAPGAVIEGDPSAPVCVTPVDVFPPAAPRGLIAAPGPTAIGLVWEPNAEPDVGGYLILRGEAGGDTLTLLTPDGPISDARFVDDAVRQDVTYVYEVVAIDRRVPVPNRSAPARIEVTAR